MFRDMFLKVRVFELRDQRPDDDEEQEEPQPSVNDEPNRASAEEGGWFCELS